MRRTRLLPALAAIPLVAVCVYVFGGPQIDPSRVVLLDDLMPMAMPCLVYRWTDHHGWPLWRNERAYLRFLQDNGVRLAFMLDDDGGHSALVGFLDSLRIRQLHEQAKAAGVIVPRYAFTSRIEQ